MAKPFANSQQYNGDLIDSYIMELQIGSNTDDGGLAQMRSIQLGKLKSYLKEGMGATFNYRGKYGTLPTDLAVGDSFVASMTFTVGGQTYEEGHLYAWNGTSWDDITDIFTQYAQQAEVDSINERLTEAEEKIDALSGFIFKGEATRATLPTPSASNQGWVYYLTDESIYVASDGTQWVTVMSFVGQTIAEGDTTHAPSSDAVYKALAERDAKDADLQSQIVNTNAELDNVEALIGGDAQVENTDPTDGESLLAQSRLIHHANLLPNGSFGRVGARSVAWNQIFDASINPQTVRAGVTIGYDGNYITLNGTASATESISGWFNLYYATGFAGKAGHRIGATLIIASGTITGNFSLRIDSVTFSPSNPTNFVNLVADSANNLIYTQGTVFDNVKITFPCVDLTAMGLASLTADQFRALFPASYYPHDEGHIYDLNPTGFRIRGINLWDEEWEGGRYDASGNKSPDNGRIRCVNPIPVTANTEYYIKIGNYAGNYCAVFEYDGDGNFIRQITPNASTHLFTTSGNCCYITFFLSDLYGTSYNHDVQICDNSLPTSIKTTYHPSEHHIVETTQIANGHYVNDSCYDYVENVIEDGIVKGKNHTVVGSYTFTGNETWTRETSGAIYIFRSALTGKKVGLDNLLILGYATTDVASSSAMPDKSVRGHATSPTMLLFRDDSFNDATSFAQSLAGRTIYFGIANETITDCEPLRSFGISDYSTVEPITPQDELVNRIDVPFSVKSVSANTLIEQIIQNTADIAEEKTTRTAQVSALEKRVTNLELKTGDQFDVDYPSDTYGMDGVPSNVEPYAQGKVLKGVSRVKNSLINSAFHAGSASNGITPSFNYSTLSIGFTGTATAYADAIAIDAYPCLTLGHVYAVGLKPLSGFTISDNYNYINEIVGSYVFTATSTYFNIRGRVASGTTVNYSSPISLLDLTQYFANDPAVNVSTLTIADIQQKYPWLLVSSDNDSGSEVHSVYNGFKSKSRNLFNGIWEVGYLNPSNGSVISSSGYKTTDYIPIKPLTEFYIMGTQTSPDSVNVAYYGQNKEFIYHVGSVLTGLNRTFTTQSGVYYMRITITNASTKTEGFMLNQSDNQNGTFTEYFEDTLTLPTPVELRSAGSVADTDELNVEVEVDREKVRKRRQTKKISPYVFDGVTDVSSSSTGWMTNCYSFRISTAKSLELDAKVTVNTLCSRYIISMTPSSVVGSFWLYKDAEGLVIYINHDNNTMGMTAFKALLQSNPITFNFIRETPVVTLSDPILDNYIKVEPNGTVEPVQSQSPEVDSAMTAEYMAA